MLKGQLLHLRVFCAFTGERHHMLLTNRFSALVICGLVAGCAPPVPVQTMPDGMPVVQMIFDAPPVKLFTAVEAVCNRPDQRVLRGHDDMVECRRLLPPEGAAGAILGYDGTITALPESVLRFDSETLPHGHVVRASSFLAVPQRQGGVLRVAFPDARVDRALTRMLRDLGGTPYPGPKH